MGIFLPMDLKEYAKTSQKLRNIRGFSASKENANRTTVKPRKTTNFLARILPKKPKTILEQYREIRTNSKSREVVVEKPVYHGPPGPIGPQGPQGDRGERGEQGASITGPAGKDGQDVSEIEPKILAERLNTLTGAIKAKVIEGLPEKFDIRDLKHGGKYQLELRDIKGARLDTPSRGDVSSDMRYHGGGDVVTAGTNITIVTNASGQKVISATSGGLSIVAITGTINDSNVSFTALSQPTLLIINGGTYQQAGGAITWTYVAGIITLSSPVGSGGSIFGL